MSRVLRFLILITTATAAAACASETQDPVRTLAVSAATEECPQKELICETDDPLECQELCVEEVEDPCAIDGLDIVRCPDEQECIGGTDPLGNPIAVCPDNGCAIAVDLDTDIEVVECEDVEDDPHAPPGGTDGSSCGDGDCGDGDHPQPPEGTPDMDGTPPPGGTDVGPCELDDESCGEDTYPGGENGSPEVDA